MPVNLRTDPIFCVLAGTNDVGLNTLYESFTFSARALPLTNYSDNLTGGQINNATIVDITACAVNVIQTLYNSGARNSSSETYRQLPNPFVFSLIHKPDACADDPVRAASLVPGRLVPEQVLDCAMQHHGLESLRPEMSSLRQQDFGNDAQIPQAVITIPVVRSRRQEGH